MLPLVPATKPAPEPDDVTAFYWEGAAAGTLLVNRCADCGYFSHPPDVSCQRCASTALEPTPVSGLGTVYSFTIVRQAFDPAFLPEVPYLVALVELDEQPGLLLLANVVDVDIETVEIGDRVEVTFEARDGQPVPQFRPLRTSEVPA
jgi:uncharacterized OB-fold protein